MLQEAVDLEASPRLVRVDDLAPAEGDVRRRFGLQYPECHVRVHSRPAAVELELRKQFRTRATRLFSGHERVERRDLQAQVGFDRLGHRVEQRDRFTHFDLLAK